MSTSVSTLPSSRQPPQLQAESLIALFVERFSRPETRSVTFLVNSEEVRKFLSELDSDQRLVCCKAIFTHMLTRVDDTKAIDKFVNNTLQYLDIIKEPALRDIALDLEAQIKRASPGLQIPSLSAYTTDKAEILKRWASCRPRKEESAIVPAKPTSIRVRDIDSEERRKICMQLQDVAQSRFSSALNSLKKELAAMADWGELTDSDVEGVAYSTFLGAARTNVEDKEKAFRDSFDSQLKVVPKLGAWTRRRKIRWMERESKSFYSAFRSTVTTLNRIEVRYRAIVSQFISDLIDSAPEMLMPGEIRSPVVEAAHSKIDASSEYKTLRAEYGLQCTARYAAAQASARLNSGNSTSHDDDEAHFFHSNDDMLH